MKVLILFLLLLNCLFAKNDQVSLQLKWKHQFQFAGYYMAKEKGFYDAEKIDVKIYELQDGNPVDLVTNGKFDFGVDDSFLIYERLKGKDIVALFAAFQHSPLALVGLKKNNIDHPRKLKDKTIELTNMSDGSDISIQNLLELTNIEYIAKKPTFDIEDLINGKTDIVAGYVSNEPFRLLEKGFEALVINPKDYGFDFYGDMLYTSHQLLHTDPELVKRFYHASIQGWIYALNHIEESVELIYKKYNTQNKSKNALLYEANVLKELAGDLHRFGIINQEKIKQIATVYSLKMENPININAMQDFIYAQNKDEANRVVRLTIQEEQYLSKKKKINICVNEGSFPYEDYHNGKVLGLMGEYLEEVAAILKIEIQPIPYSKIDLMISESLDWRCDFISTLKLNEKQFNGMLSTKIFIKDDYEMVTSIDVPSIDISTKTFLDKTFYVLDQKDRQLIYKKFPKIKIHINENLDEVIQKIKENKNSVLLVPTLQAERIVQKYGFDVFKVNEVLPNVSKSYGLATNKENQILIDILNKTIEILDKNEFYKIVKEKYVLKEYTFEPTFKFLKYGLTLLFVLLFLLYLQNKKNKQIESEKMKFQELLNNSVDGIFITTLDGITIHCSQAFADILGYEKEEMQGMYASQWSTLVQTNKDHIEQIIQKKESRFETQFITKNGSKIDVDVLVKIIEMDNHQYIYGSARDITESKRKDALLMEQSKMASLGDMIGNIAHQWRQPLAVMTATAADVKISMELRKELSKEKIQDFIDVVNEQAIYLSQTINDFRNFIKEDHTLLRIDLSDIVEETFKIVKPTLENHNITVIMNLQKDYEILANKNELMQAFINFTNNSKDAIIEKCDVGESYIFIFVRPIKSNKIEVEFLDNGGGIDESIKNRIFEPYFTTKHKELGTGLGMSMSYKIITERHHGTLEIENKEFEYQGKHYVGASIKATFELCR